MPVHRRTTPGTRRAAAAVVAATAVLLQQPSASARPHDATGALSGTEAECLDAGEVQLLALINSYRTDHGLAALAPSRRLDVSAYRHSEDQATNRYFGVASPDGSSPAERAHDQGYPSAFVGENVSAGRPAVRAVFRSWRADSSSNANLLRPEYRAIGLGHLSQPGSQWFTYWTADFGDIADGGPTCGG